MVDIPAALTVASKTLDLIRGLKELDHSLDTAEMKAAMAELYVQVADLKMALSDTRDDLRARDQRIWELEQQIHSVGHLVEVQGYKYDANEDSGLPVGFPYCPTCYVRESKLYRLVRWGDRLSRCHNCDRTYPASADGIVHGRPFSVAKPLRGLI